MTWTEASLIRRIDWAPQLATFCFDTKLDGFAPGQWLNIALNVAEERITRAYSLASAPGAGVQLFVTEVDSGALTPGLFSMQLGDRLQLDTTARGFFSLDYVPEAQDLWLVATGTGLGPFISILRAGALFERFEHVVVVHGVRRADHLAYADEIRALRPERCAVSYVPVVSREPERSGVLHGRVTAALSSGQLEDAAGRVLSPARSHLMLCGNPEMITDLMALLSARGLQRHRVRKPGHVTIEKYW
ncbi:MAG TPA: ferredoxin--NADP reductase [Polyangiaceae bacterium]|nr:ferredoxin--NADP reductase [Polyangiaceae bacterium]HMR74459.1 ferredoxin--NADP reductase [Polyangiaceae bacterium]